MELKKVICTSNNDGYYSLKIGNPYTVYKETISYYSVINEHGRETQYPRSIFIDMPDFVPKQYPTTPEECEPERKVRVFETGAIRSSNIGRERYDFISPLALRELAMYLATTENSIVQTNYYLGIPIEACIESLLRHINDFRINGNKKEALAILFNAVALTHTIALKENGEYNIIQEGTKLMPESEFMEIYNNQNKQ